MFLNAPVPGRYLHPDRWRRRHRRRRLATTSSPARSTTVTVRSTTSSSAATTSSTGGAGDDYLFGEVPFGDGIDRRVGRRRRHLRRGPATTSCAARPATICSTAARATTPSTAAPGDDTVSYAHRSRRRGRPSGRHGFQNTIGAGKTPGRAREPGRLALRRHAEGQHGSNRSDGRPASTTGSSPRAGEDAPRWRFGQRRPEHHRPDRRCRVGRDRATTRSRPTAAATC